MPNKKGEFRSGFVQLAHISDRQQLKVFYTDVGQGDASLIEAEGAIVIIDGGPSRGFYDVLKDRLAGLRRADQAIGLPPRQRLRINAIVISHFDKDHYFGLKKLFEDDEFEVGVLYHNGLPRYGASAGIDLNLGDVVEHQDGTTSISTDLTDTESAQDMIDNNLLLAASGGRNQFNQFMQAVIDAEAAGRVDDVKRLVVRNATAATKVLSDTGPDMRFEILGPVTTKTSGSVRLPVFPDPHDITATNPDPEGSESHTINGNSIVIRLVYGDFTFLFGGDLNQPAQKYLKDKYGGMSMFECDVNKACHHGSSDFDINYVKKVKPAATVFSSGDNGSYDHPLPDAIGAAARHSRGTFPLIFSTELARDNKTSGKIMLGHINARCNGNDLVMAQKKEKAGSRNPWHTFGVPYSGPFGH
jgi:beta-lactamase superfamily II metal-dependent hydrolase